MKKNEKVLVVARDIIFKEGVWQGIKTENLDYYLGLIKKNYQFKKRGEIEENPSWQQIIPYILFSYKDKYFLYKYLEKAGEQRLVNNYQLGIGGHINYLDTRKGKDFLESAAMREWNEEVKYKGDILNKNLVGILNDDTRPVEKVHLGLIYHFRGDSPEIAIKEKDIMEGELVNLNNLGQYVKNIQGWSPIVYRDYLSKFL